MGLDIRHQVLRVALSVKVNGKRRRLSLHRARPPRTCVKLSMKITVTTSRVGAYPHTQKSGLRRLTGAYPHTKISVAQSYPDPYVFGIQGDGPSGRISVHSHTSQLLWASSRDSKFSVSQSVISRSHPARTPPPALNPPSVCIAGDRVITPRV